MSTRNLRKRKAPVDPVLEFEKVDIKAELEDACLPATLQQSTGKKGKRKSTSKLKTQLLQNTESKLKDTTCKHCQQIFKSPVERLHHNRTCQGNTSKVKTEILQDAETKVKDCTCKHCRQIFESPMERLRHSRTCQDGPMILLPPNEIEKYFDWPDITQCPICYKPIATRNFRSVFIKHLLVHTTGLYHQCSICKLLFRRRENMRAHEKRHIVSL